MRLKRTRNNGFTLGELMVTVGIGAFMLAAILTSSIALQRTFNAVDNYFEAELLQIRIIDFINRDVKRSFIVTNSTDYRTIACIMPNYIIQAGDSDAGSGNANVGKRRTPTVTRSANGTTVNYLTRTVFDAVTTSGSKALTSVTASFTSADLNKTISGTGIPAGTTVQAVNSPISVTMLNNATASSSLGTATIGAQTTVIYSVSSDKQSVDRNENGVSTTVATTADQLVPLSTDIELSNTEFTLSTITFRPVFTSTETTASRSGTKLFSTAYLRNKRRG
jgi:hypothetical protein